MSLEKVHGNSLKDTPITCDDITSASKFLYNDKILPFLND